MRPLDRSHSFRVATLSWLRANRTKFVPAHQVHLRCRGATGKFEETSLPLCAHGGCVPTSIPLWRKQCHNLDYALRGVNQNGHLEVVWVLLEHTPCSITLCHTALLNKQWDVVALLLEHVSDLSHEDWLEMQLSCVANGQSQSALLARPSYLQRRDAFAHQFHWR